MRNRARRRKTVPQRHDIFELAARFRVNDEAFCICDGCGAARTHHVPVCGEHDPYLISFWVSLCDGCLEDERRGQMAARKVRARGWARPGFVVPEAELPPREEYSALGELLEQLGGLATEHK